MSSKWGELSKLTVSILAIAMSVACSQNAQPERSIASETGPEAAITNGEAVAANDAIAKSTVALYVVSASGDRAQSFCTGTLIAPNVVLSAAHCFVDFAKSLGTTVEVLESHVQIGFGTSVVSKRSDQRTKFVLVEKVDIHPDYQMDNLDGAAKGEASFDLSVIHLKGRAPAGAAVAQVSSDRSILKEGLALTLAGFGKTRVGIGTPLQNATELRKVDVSIAIPELNPTQFAFMTIDGKSSCNGDSGGPAYLKATGRQARPILVGVTSWGDNGCEKAGVYTSTASLITWIRSVL